MRPEGCRSGRSARVRAVARCVSGPGGRVPGAAVSAGLHRPRCGRAGGACSPADRPHCRGPAVPLRQAQEAQDERADPRRPFGRLLSASPALPGAVHDIRGAREHSNRTAQPPRTPRHTPEAAHPAHAATTPQTHPANAATPAVHTNPSAEHDPAAPHDAHPPPPRSAPTAARPPLPLLKPLRQKHRPGRPVRRQPTLHTSTLQAPHRGAGDALMLVCDGLSGLPDAVETVRPQTTVQTCVVHPLLNSLHYAARRDWDRIAELLKPVCTAETEDAALERTPSISPSTAVSPQPAGNSNHPRYTIRSRHTI